MKTGRELYLGRPLARSRWRVRARGAISRVIDANPEADTRTLLAAVDAAYPFGERAHHPYKAWLAERAQLIDDLKSDTPPSPEEWAAIEVAGDLLELGRAEEARKLLDEQAPLRHARRCESCGAAPGKPCREAEVATFALTRPFQDAMGHTFADVTYVERAIPHAARVQP